VAVLLVVFLSVGVHDNKPYICIEDDGEGIDATQRKDVLKPFCRGTSSATKQGHGMGLAIVDRIARWMRQTLMIEKS
jgi:signal transduction histidine kinase